MLQNMCPAYRKIQFTYGSQCFGRRKQARFVKVAYLTNLALSENLQTMHFAIFNEDTKTGVMTDSSLVVVAQVS